MRVADVLKSNRQSLATCIPEESITSICTRLSALNIGAFPVCDARRALVGMIPERDVVRAFAKEGARLADMHVRDLMTREVTTCSEETTMLEAEKLMNKHRVRHLPVMDDGKARRRLSIRDVMVGDSTKRATRSSVPARRHDAVRNRAQSERSSGRLQGLRSAAEALGDRNRRGSSPLDVDVGGAASGAASVPRL